MDKAKLLFVDDDPVYLRAMLEGLGNAYDVQVASDGNEALFAMDKECPDICFLDYDMPGIDGKECLEVIRGMPGGESMKCVFVTGERTVGKVVEVMNYKPSKYMTKPVTVEDIKKTIAELLPKKDS